MSLSRTFLASRTHEELRAIQKEGGMLNKAPNSGVFAYDQAMNHPERGYIGHGNVVSETQFSSYIRAETTLLSNGHNFARGELRARDLGAFASTIPNDFMVRVLEASEDKDVILYRFSHPRGKAIAPVVHGWVLTDEFHRLIATSVENERSRPVIEAMTPAVSFSDAGMSDPSPTEDYLAISEGVNEEIARAYAAENGWFMATTAEEAKAGPMPFAFNENAPVFLSKGDAWLRARSFQDAFAMISIRENVIPSVANDWIWKEAPWDANGAYDICQDLSEDDVTALIEGSDFELTELANGIWQVNDPEDETLSSQSGASPGEAFYHWAEKFHMQPVEIRQVLKAVSAGAPTPGM